MNTLMKIYLALPNFFDTGLVLQYLNNHSLSDVTKITIPVSIACFLLIMVSAYLLGSLNFAIIISSKQYRQDIRNFGSKNAGMTNMMRTYGKKAAALTLFGDAMKAVVSCLIGYALYGQLGAYVAGIFCILGHMFPVYYRFKGGKGVVTAGITIMMCNPIVFLILITMFLIIVLISRYISLGSVMCMLIYPILLDRMDAWLLGIPVSPYVWCAALMTILVVVKHWENIKRLSQGKENKFSFKKSVKAPAKEEKNEEPASKD